MEKYFINIKLCFQKKGLLGLLFELYPQCMFTFIKYFVKLLKETPIMWKTFNCLEILLRSFQCSLFCVLRESHPGLMLNFNSDFCYIAYFRFFSLPKSAPLNRPDESGTIPSREICILNTTQSDILILCLAFINLEHLEFIYVKSCIT